MSDLQINDSLERKSALDISHSIIVQAPAGSGKTELLTQRYLNLLANATKSPEEVIAITFTKKAAAEMQDRIINALQFAQNNPKPEDEFAATTWQLAKDTLKQDQKRDWQLLKNPKLRQVYRHRKRLKRLLIPLFQIVKQQKRRQHQQFQYQKRVNQRWRHRYLTV